MKRLSSTVDISISFWRYDVDKSGDLDEMELKDFVTMVLDFHEKNMAKKLGRDPRPIPEENIKKVFTECAKN